MCPRHQTGLDRRTKHNEDDKPYHCNKDDCKRVVWFDSIPGPTNDTRSFEVMGCYECGRQTRFVRCDVPDDTIFLDENDEPIPKSEENNIPTVN